MRYVIFIEYLNLNYIIFTNPRTLHTYGIRYITYIIALNIKNNQIFIKCF